MTKITSVEVRDVKKVEFVRIEPDGNITIVGGKNRAGKSSLLDAIAYCLGGKKLCPSKPIREGQDTGSVTVHLDGDEESMLPPCNVTRSFARRGDGSIKSELEIKSDDGYMAPTPQGILDSLLSTATFDPLAFTRLKAKDQADQLRQLVGIDTTALDRERESVYAERTQINRDVKQIEAKLKATPKHDNTPGEEIVVSDLVKELKRRQAVNGEHARKRREAESQQRHLEDYDAKALQAVDRVKQIEAELLKAKEAVEELHRQRDEYKLQIETFCTEVKSLNDEDTSEVEQQISEAELINVRVRDNAKHYELTQELKAVTAQASKKTQRLTAIDVEKRKMFEQAQWPVDGLGFDTDGVTLNGLPFDQASSAEALEVSVAMGFALNPKLKMLIIRDGSLLDEESLARIAELAAEQDGQVFLERVGEGSECHVVLCDGKVKTAEDEKTLFDGDR